MRINKVDFTPNHTGIYRLHAKVDPKELMYRVVSPYMFTHHHGVIIQNGENPYSPHFYEKLDEFLSQNNYSKSWLIQNAKNNNFNEIVDLIDNTTTTIITKESDIKAIAAYVDESGKSQSSIKDKILKMLGIKINNNEYQKEAEKFATLPSHLKELYAHCVFYLKKSADYNEALKGEIVDVYSIEELYSKIMREPQ